MQDLLTFRNAAALLVVATGILASAVRARAAEPVVRVAGTGSAVEAMARIGREAAAAGAGVRVESLRSLGSTGAIQAVAAGAIDVGVTSRPLKVQEKTPVLAEREFARTPFVFAVGPSVKTAGITPETVVAFYRGTLLTWPDGQRVRAVLRPAHDSDSDLLASISPEVAAALEAARKRPGMLLAVTNTECNEMVSRTPGSFGPTSLLQVRSEGLPLVPLRWNGVEPTLAALASGAYPLEKRLRLVFRTPASEGVKRLLAWLASPAGRALLRELGALPVDFPPAG